MGAGGHKGAVAGWPCAAAEAGGCPQGGAQDCDEMRLSGGGETHTIERSISPANDAGTGAGRRSGAHANEGGTLEHFFLHSAQKKKKKNFF